MEPGHERNHVSVLMFSLPKVGWGSDGPVHFFVQFVESLEHVHALVEAERFPRLLAVNQILQFLARLVDTHCGDERGRALHVVRLCPDLYT
jgi:hypothetical protein